MRQGRRFTADMKPNSESSRSGGAVARPSSMDKSRSSTYPKENIKGSSSTTGAFRRVASARCVSLLGVVGLAALSMLAPGCHEFDTERTPPKRASVGTEMFGVICDRVAAQALREDLSGDSFRAVCHKPVGKGDFADTVDTTKLPPLDPEAGDEKGNIVPMAKQKADREKSIGRIEALARRRNDLIQAFDATFPEEKIPIKDIDNEDPTKSCDAPKKSGEGLLTDQLADMLGRMGNLYNDGTLPQSTESLATVVDAFKKDEAAQKAWARISARQGYRPIETALGVARPVIAYPGLRDFSNASLRLLSADSKPYDPNPTFDADGHRVLVAGPGNAAMNKLLEAAHEEMLSVKADDPLPALTIKADGTGRPTLSRPRDNLEMLSELLYTEDDAFASGANGKHFIVRRDSRGYARIRDGLLPAPFVDADKDGLPDVDEVGRFKTTNGSIVPSPFTYPGAPEATRDADGRVTAGGGLLYDYIDTTRVFAAQMMKDMRPLVNPDPSAKHETIMDMMGGLPVMMGPRETRTKTYDTKKSVQYDGIKTAESPMLDLVYAMGAILGDRTSDQTLAMARELFTTNQKQMARITGAMNSAFDIAQNHPEAVIPRTSTFWDENLEIMAKLVKEPGLLEDVLRALAAPETQELGNTFSKFAKFKDEITYDENDINGLPYNVTTKSKGEMKTPVDRAAPLTGTNRSAMQRFLMLIGDTMGVTACNKPDAKVHISAGINISVPGTFKECAVFKIENLGAFYLDAIANANQYDTDQDIPRGTIYMRPSLLRAGSVVLALSSVIEDSSGITGMWPSGKDIVAPTPNFLNRLVFFDLKNDTKNAQTKTFVGDLQGEHIGTAACPERVIDDPDPGAKDASPDGKVHGLRNCPEGQWLNQRGKNTIFTWEEFGFYTAIRPLLGAFVKHHREDLFLELSAAVYKHYPDQNATPDECRLSGTKQCTKEGMNSYEALISEALAGDVIPALGEIAKTLDTMAIKTCGDATCTAANVKTISGIDVAAAAARATLDPDYAKSIKLTDRLGNVTAKRNDGTTVPQVTPAYLLTNALTSIDLAFDKWEEQHPDDKERRAGWRRARSQLVDQFLGVQGIKSNSTFTNPTIPKMTPVILDMVRAQLMAHCPGSFAPPYPTCKWAREELVKKAEDSLAGPLATTGIDVMDAMRRDQEGRVEMEKLLSYLLDAASKNDALPSMLASANDAVQMLRDDENLVPLFHVLANAVDATQYDAQGRIKQKSLVDAQMALLARLSGKYYDKDNKEICKNEVDPNQILANVLGKLVTPIKDGSFKGQSPLEVIVDVIADVNRDDPTQPYDGTLKQADYNGVSSNVVDFLTNKERGLEQFYEVIRQGTKF